jgi:hypothetical protein
MLATSLRVHQLEMNRPLTESEESIIRANLKPPFVPQIECWALVQSRSHRKKFFEFLENPEARKPARALTSLSPGRPEKDFLLLSPTCQLNFTKPFRDTQTTRRNNRSRFASPGITGHGIFNENPVKSKPRPAAYEGETLGRFIVRRLMLPASAPKFLDIADANIRLLQELNHWVDRKNTNQFPVDNLLTHPTLSPFQAQTANMSRNHEDHLSRPNIPPLPHNVASGPTPLHLFWKTPRTAYTAFFDDDERFRKNYVSPPFPPLESSQPFCKFPQSPAVPPNSTVNPLFVRQAKEDTRLGRKYKSIFESKTVL